MSCPRSYHLPCAAEAECHFDPKRHIDRLGGLFCPKHVTSADAAHAVGGPAKDWAAALERAMAAVRPESAKRSRTKVGKDEVEDEDQEEEMRCPRTTSNSQSWPNRMPASPRATIER